MSADANANANELQIHRQSKPRAYCAWGCFASFCLAPNGYPPRSATGVQQPRDGAVDLVVLAFAVVLKDDPAVLVDDVLRRPILIAVGVPGSGIIVLRHRIGDAVPL